MKTEALKFTYADYKSFPDDGKRHEIIDGEHYVAPAPSSRHQTVVLNLASALLQHVRQYEMGRVFSALIDVILSDEDVVQPDVLFITAERADIVEKHAVAGAPDLIVEVLSEGNRRFDEIGKRDLYAQSGVKEYWIVDPELETVKVYRHPEGGYERAAELAAERNAYISTPLLPEFNHSLTHLYS